MEFRILGPLEVVSEEGALPLGAHQQRALLALLLLHRNEPMSTDRLADLLWGERAPPTAAKTIQVYVSQLRRVLGPGALETHGHGYVLRVDADELDAARFETLLDRGRELISAGDAPRAAETLRAGLAIWRGQALADFAYESFAQTEIARLDELRLAALEERVEAELSLGEHARLVPELEALVREHPLRERLRAQLILALYRCGRQADALEAYRQTRIALVDELGLEPSRALQELEQAILRQDPELEPPLRRAMTVRGRRVGGMAIAIGGSLLVLAAVAAAVVALARGDGDTVLVPSNSVAAIDPKTNRVVASASVGEGPTSVAAARGKVWVLNRDAQTISVIDAKTKTLLKTFGVGATPVDLAVGESSLWVGDSAGPSVLELDPDTGVVVRRVRAPPLAPPPPRPPLGGSVAVGPHAVWFDSGNTTLTRIDPSTGRVVARLRHRGFVGDRSHIAVDGDSVWVSSCCGELTRVDGRTNEIAAAVNIPATGPIAAGVDGLWIIDTFKPQVWRIERSGGFLGQISVDWSTRVGANPLDLAVGEGSVWVASADGTVTRINPITGDVQASIRVGGSAAGIAVGEGAVWVAVG